MAAAKKAAAAVKASAAKKAAATKAPATKPPAKAPAKATTKAPAKKASAAKAPAKASAKKAPTKPTPAPAPKSPPKSSRSKSSPPKSGTNAPAPAASRAPVPAKKAPSVNDAPAKKAPKKNPFDAKFLAAQHELLLVERATYDRQARALQAEADELAALREPGDVQFDEESGEGDTLAVERERDLALSAQARAAIEDIDHAIAKLELGTYGICEVSGDPIPRERLEAIPWARERVEHKVGGFGRR